VGEALADDARTATPPLVPVETMVTSPPVAGTRVETPPCVAEEVGASAGDVGASAGDVGVTTSPNNYGRRPHQNSSWWG
jgi:hypothetical protein